MGPKTRPLLCLLLCPLFPPPPLPRPQLLFPCPSLCPASPIRNVRICPLPSSSLPSSTISKHPLLAGFTLPASFPCFSRARICSVLTSPFRAIITQSSAFSMQASIQLCLYCPPISCKGMMIDGFYSQRNHDPISLLNPVALVFLQVLLIRRICSLSVYYWCSARKNF
jgi:hypothetical protein